MSGDPSFHLHPNHPAPTLCLTYAPACKRFADPQARLRVPRPRHPPASTSLPPTPPSTLPQERRRQARGIKTRRSWCGPCRGLVGISVWEMERDVDVDFGVVGSSSRARSHPHRRPHLCPHPLASQEQERSQEREHDRAAVPRSASTPSATATRPEQDSRDRAGRAMKRCKEEREPQSDLDVVNARRIVKRGRRRRMGREGQGARADPALGVYITGQDGWAVGDVRAGGGELRGASTASAAAAPWAGAWLRRFVFPRRGGRARRGGTGGERKGRRGGRDARGAVCVLVETVGFLWARGR
ncbi:hypothetical protein B0H13DRAFT_2285595, partial [Mycena leptocephala]